jgi:hypothetical protein
VIPRRVTKFTFSADISPMDAHSTLATADNAETIPFGVVQQRCSLAEFG